MNYFGRYKDITAIVISLFVGFSVSSGLLLYNGKELVNALVYLSIVVYLPFLFSLFSFFSLLFKFDKKHLNNLELSYLFGLFFSIAALVSLLFTVTIKDIAFGWATTLSVNPKELSSFLNSLAIWKSFCSNCIISEHLAQISQIIRLGGKIDIQKITQAKELGTWWRYLALSILIYGVFFRGFLWLTVKFLNRNKEIKFSAEPNVETVVPINSEYKNKTTQDKLKEKKFRVVKYHTNCNLEGDKKAKDIVVCVKSWEPPILDFFDFLEELQEQNRDSKISIFLLGLNGSATESDINIWQRKLNELKLNYEVIV